MGEFFKGWRRKAGCILLVMALAFMAGWMRSLFVLDVFTIQAGAMTSIGIESKRQFLCFSWVQDNSDRKITIPVWMALDSSIQGTVLPNDYKIGEFACLICLGDEYPRGVILAAPYWSVTMPLTLLSAFLILWPTNYVKSSRQTGSPRPFSN